MTPKVERIEFKARDGSYRGIGTRVTFADGWRITFVGPVSKKEAIQQASAHKLRGVPSETDGT